MDASVTNYVQKTQQAVMLVQGIELYMAEEILSIPKKLRAKCNSCGAGFLYDTPVDPARGHSASRLCEDCRQN